ncbi:MAG: peptidoglycan-binding protein [Treponema sp.]|nr:peptidoglycan-binding protein [Treponema sp.]
MNCGKAMDIVYGEWGTASPPFLSRYGARLHILRCPRCAAEAARLKTARSIMRESFPPPPADLEERIMRSVNAEEQSGEYPEVAGFSFRSWVVTGLIVLFSLSSSFFWEGASPLHIGITVGAIVTAYGAIFIGSHLKELTERFNIR